VTIEDAQERVIEEFSHLPDWFDKYEYLIDRGKKHPPMDERYKTDEYALPGCQSQVWIRAEFDDGVVCYYADSDSVITKGILALLLQVVNNRPASAIANADIYFTKAIGLSTNLSPTRANGLALIIRRLKQLSRDYSEINGR
jgi:cysteine desulfuration protein SufE